MKAFGAGRQAGGGEQGWRWGARGPAVGILRLSSVMINYTSHKDLFSF